MGEDCSGLPTQGRRLCRPGDKGSEGGRYPNKCCASRDLGSQEIPHPRRHLEKPQKPIGCLKWNSDV